MLFPQSRRQRKFQNLFTTQRERCRWFNFLAFCENFGPRHDVILAPNDQVRPTLHYAAFQCVPNKIVEPIQGTLQLSIRKHAGQTRYCQHKQQHEYEYGEDNLDQRKTSQTLHRQIYAIGAKSQQPPERGTASLPSSPRLPETSASASMPASTGHSLSPIDRTLTREPRPLVHHRFRVGLRNLS